jgi:hypothetical protein
LKKEKDRQKVAEDVAKFLANGGSITKIPTGVSNDKYSRKLTVVPREWNGNDRYV